ncbi:MAG: GHKL domain-containing protein [Proteobacteria bacterium]|nr:GHKL domain-containing protein [Pseudomonadota bacterium]
MNIKSFIQLFQGPSITGENLANFDNGKGILSPLKFKGYLFNILLVAYIAFITAFVLSQRDQPLEQLEQYQKIQKAQEALVQADLAAFHIVTVLFSEVSQSDLESVVQYFSSLRDQYINLQQWFPEQAEAFRALVESIPATLDEPSERNLKNIHFHLARSKTELDRLMVLNSERLTDLVASHRAHNESVVVTTLALGIMGLILLGGITSLFFSRLKKDLNALQKRTAEIVQGYRGEPLPVSRNDEVGYLTQGVNYMADALAEREQALEIQRSTVSFMEKMVAIDSLTGGIAHEIGNPVTCIAGLAEVLKNDEDSQLSEESRQSLEAILDHIDGLVRLTRELSVFDTHKSDEYEWLDINRVVSNTCSIFNYDKRWAGIQINMDLDHSIPAIFASVNQLTQLISNILENAMDAERNIQQPEVIISTQLQDSENLLIRISDNGQGMDQDVMAHIFDPFFSTKPVGLGTGLGLAICWSIVKAHNGTIKATSTVSQGSEISIILPIKKAESSE